MDDAYVYLVDLPNKVKGFSVPDANSDFTIYINKRLSFEEMRETYLHELRHIANGDFEKQDVHEIEAYEH